MKNSKILDITLGAAFTAIICLFTMFIQIRIFPTQGGMVHIGNVPLFFVAAFYGKKIGAVSGGVGMFLSDLLTGWVTYSVATLIVVAIMGWVFGAIVNQKITLLRLLTAVVAALGIKLAGYYLFEMIFIYHHPLGPVANIPGNTIQILTGAIIAVPLILATMTVMVRLKENHAQVTRKEA